MEREKIKKKNLKKISDWYHDGELNEELFDLCYKLI